MENSSTCDASKLLEKWLPDLEYLSVTMSSSASQVASNTDVLIEILKRLPIKSLLGFKSVSKQWLSLMSDPHFILKHFIQNPQLSIAGLMAIRYFACLTGEIIFLEGRNSFAGSGSGSGASGANPLQNLSLLDSMVPDLMIVQSCNGLLLCKSGCFQVLNLPDYVNYHICNPCTRKCKTLSSLPRFSFNFSTPAPIDLLSVSLAFDPSKSPHYKLVCVLKGGKTNEVISCSTIHIYSSKTDKWSLSENQFDAPNCIGHKTAVFWNGSLNWVGNLANSDYSICFLIDQELTKRVPLPRIPDRRHPLNILYFGECTGHLYFIESYDELLTSLDILEMEMDFSAWNVKYCVNLEVLPTAFPETEVDMSIYFTDSLFLRDIRMLLVQEEEDHFQLIIQIPGGKVVSYNTKEMNFKVIHKFGPYLSVGYTVMYDGITSYHQFIESLANV